MKINCRECITAELTVRDKCPLCRQQISVAELTEGMSVSRGEDDQLDAGVSSSSTTTAVASESKLRMLLDEVSPKALLPVSAPRYHPPFQIYRVTPSACGLKRKDMSI